MNASTCIENPSGEYSIDIRGTNSGNYTLIVGRISIGQREETVVANEIQIQKNAIDTYQVNAVIDQSTNFDLDENDSQNGLFLVLLITIIILVAITGILILTFFKRNKNGKQK